MKKKILLVISLILISVSSYLYAQDVPIEIFYHMKSDRVSYDMESIQGIQNYKTSVNNALLPSDLSNLGDLRTVITLNTPMNSEKTIDFINQYNLKVKQLVIYSLDNMGNIETTMLSEVSDKYIKFAFEQLSDNEVLGSVAMYVYTGIDNIQNLQQDERVFLADYSADRKLFSLRGKFNTNREKTEIEAFVSQRHHLAWTLYTEKLGLK